MSQRKKLYDSIMQGFKDNDISYEDMCNLLSYLGFKSRQNGSSHRVFVREDAPEIITIQNKNGKCKGYQVKQIREIFKRRNIHV